MKIIAAAAIIGFCMVLQISDSNAYLAQRKALANQQIFLLNVTTRILLVQEQIASLIDVEAVPAEFSANLTRYFDHAKKTIEDKVNAASASGKLAGLCSTTALTSLTALNKTVVSQFQNTAGHITNGIFEFLHQTDLIVEFARSIGVHLFAIPTLCYNVDKAESQACATRLLGNLTESIGNFLTAANNILQLAESADGLLGLIAAVPTLRTIAATTLTAASTGIGAIETAVTTCIDALQIIQISPPKLGLSGISLG